MFPFWDTVIEPLIRASGAQRIVEIGALRGETTALMLDSLGPEAELHVIDPVPAFDPAEHERRFPGRYVFHRDLSLNVLPDAAAFDVALVDGDHNWYTVYNELRLLREASRRERPGAPDADPARRAVAVRAARPLLRALADPGGVPPAVRPPRDDAGADGPDAARRDEPHARTTRCRRAARATA